MTSRHNRDKETDYNKNRLQWECTIKNDVH